MKKVLLYLIICKVCICFAQTNQYKIHTLAFYNLENAFDTIDDPNTKDEYSPILKFKGNKSKVYWKKINNIAKVLVNIGKRESRTSPTLIGVCEVENCAVLTDILNTPFFKGKGYTFIHHESKDWRGIDVALIYKEHAFVPTDYKAYELWAWNDKGYKVKTRDQLLVSGFVEDELIHFIINHWPSQRGGKKKTEYLRRKSAELTLKIINELREENEDAKIILMGDFNDNPDAKCFKEVLATTAKKELSEGKKLYNPYENMFRRGYGTLGYRDAMNLFDQVIFTVNLLPKEKDFSTLKFYKAGIYNPHFLITKKGRYKGYPFRCWNFDQFRDGYSDHFPVFLQFLQKTD